MFNILKFKHGTEAFFNFHVDNREDADALKFLDMLEAAGFEQRVVDPTHKRGHTLDLVLVRHDDSLLRGLPEIVCFPNKISDHSAIVCTADIP